MATLKAWGKKWRLRRRAMVLSPAEGYRRWASQYGREPNALQLLESEALRRLFPEVAGASVLDLGCGTGRVSHLARERGAARIVAADFSLAMVSQVAADPTRSLAPLASAVAPLPFVDASFDLVVCALVLGHVADLHSALESMARVLRPGGRLLISDFHPFATLRGWERTFVDEKRGRSYAIEQHLHLFSDYLAGLSRVDLSVEALEEPLWQGYPVVFVLRARRLVAGEQAV